jgi:hypothetical protein
MMKLLLVTAASLTFVGTAYAGGGCPQSQAQAPRPELAGFLPQTDVPACAVYGENHGGWLSALVFGRPSRVQQAQGSPSGIQEQRAAANYVQ